MRFRKGEKVIYIGPSPLEGNEGIIPSKGDVLTIDSQLGDGKWLVKEYPTFFYGDKLRPACLCDNKNPRVSLLFGLIKIY